MGKPTFFVTGFPGFIGKRLVAHLAERHRDAPIYLLVLPKFADAARRYVADLPKPARFEIMQGDIVDMHLGLSGAEYTKVCDEATDIFHLAAVFYLGVPRETARKVNVEGTRNMLELAKDCRRLRRLSHFSTAFVSGDRVGVVAEDDLDSGQSFRSIYEETKFQAEKLVRRAMKDLPLTIFRPSIVVGDSKTGEIDRFDGPYYLGMLLVTSPLSVPLPLPGQGVAPLHLVPVDFVVEAAVELASKDATRGLTFHLVDPNPQSSRRVYEMIAAQVRRKLPKVSVPARAAEALLRLPILSHFAKPKTAVLGYINHLVFYNCQNTFEHLDGTAVRCPPITTYLPKLVEFVRDYYKKRRREKASHVDDQLDAGV